MNLMGLLFSFEGRINRQPFWTGVIVLIVVNVIISIITNILGSIFGPLSFLGVIASLVMIYPAAAVQRFSRSPERSTFMSCRASRSAIFPRR